MEYRDGEAELKKKFQGWMRGELRVVGRGKKTTNNLESGRKGGGYKTRQKGGEGEGNRKSVKVVPRGNDGGPAQGMKNPPPENLRGMTSKHTGERNKVVNRKKLNKKKLGISKKAERAFANWGELHWSRC